MVNSEEERSVWRMGHSAFSGDLREIRGRGEGVGEHAAGDGVGEELLQLPAPLLLGELLQERVLAPAEDLDPLEGEVLVEAPQLEARAC